MSTQQKPKRAYVPIIVLVGVVLYTALWVVWLGAAKINHMKQMNTIDVKLR